MLLDHRSNNRMNLKPMYNTVFHCNYFSILDIELNYKGNPGSTDPLKSSSSKGGRSPSVKKKDGS